MKNFKVVGSRKDKQVGDEILVIRAGIYAKGRVMALNASREEYIAQCKEDGLIPHRYTYHPNAKFYYVAFD